MVELATVHQAYSAFNRRDVDALLAVMDPAVEVNPLVAEVVSAGPWTGHDGVRRLLADADERWGHFELRCDDVVELGDQLVVLVHVSTQAGSDGVPIAGSSAHLIEHVDGIVTRLTAYRDQAAAVAAVQHLAGE